MKSYTIWMVVEECDDHGGNDAETYRDIGLPDPLGSSEDANDIRRQALQILDYATPAAAADSDLHAAEWPDV